MHETDVIDEPPTKRRGPLGWLVARTWRFWVVAALLMPLLYVGSFGPACWITARLSSGARIPPPPKWMLIYSPLGVICTANSRPSAMLRRWASVGAPDDAHVAVPTSTDSYVAFGRDAY